MNKLRRSFVVGSVAFVALCAPRAQAQDTLPAKPIRMILGFSAGGISDVLGRTLAAKISQSIGQQIIVENKPGAGGTVAADIVTKSPAGRLHDLAPGHDGACDQCDNVPGKCTTTR